MRVRLGGFGSGYGFKDVGVAGSFRSANVETVEAVEIPGVQGASGKGVERVVISLGVNGQEESNADEEEVGEVHGGSV